jgi:adenylate cyclase
VNPSEKPYAHTVLAVDDDPFILDTVARYLTKMGLRVLTTTDPESAVATASKEKPGLILSDIAMPGLDGLSLLKTLKETVATRDIPVILLTSSKDPRDMQEGLNAGAEAYLSKPIEWERSWPKIQAILLRS